MFSGCVRRDERRVQNKVLVATAEAEGLGQDTGNPSQTTSPHTPAQHRHHQLRKPCQLPPGKARASGKRHSEPTNPTITDKMDSSP